MGYIIDFVGLINFFGDTSDEKLLLLPDGRNPPDNRIPPHFANIFVISPQVVDSSTWAVEADAVMQSISVSRFAISSPSTITLSAQQANAGRGRLTISQQDALVPRLKQIDQAIEIEPDRAATIARIPINYGTLSAFILGRESVVAQLHVPHNDLLTITATPDDGSTPKTLILRNGAEIVLSNTSQIGGPKPANEISHFHLYGQLDVNRDGSRLDEPTPSAELDQLASAHPYVAFLRDSEGHIPLPGCSITNCCTCCDQ